MSTSGAAIPCADYPINPIEGNVRFNHFGSNGWWDTTTTPLPWITTPPMPNTIPYPFVTTSGTVTSSLYPTQEQKAEIVLAVLLNVLMGKDYASFENRLSRDANQLEIDFVYNDSGLIIRIPKNMKFNQIVEALYTEFGNLRGRQVR